MSTIKLEDKLPKREKIKEIFDYSSISDEQKKAIEEVVSILENNGQDILAKNIGYKFELKEHTKVPPQSSVFVTLMKEFGLNSIQQGWVLGEIDDEGKETHYPIMDMQADIRVLDNFIMFVADKYDKTK